MGDEEKLEVISLLEKGERITDMPLMLGLLIVVYDNADRIKESAKSGTTEFV